MKKSKWLSLAAMLLALALVAAACGGDDDDDAAGGDGEDQACTWSIGTLGALSGDLAAIGVPIFNGLEYAVNQVNETGDLACELELVDEDSQGSPDQAPQLAQSLAETETMVGIVGPYFSGETLATGDIFDQAGIPFICPSCTNETIDDQGWDTFFRAVGDDALQGEQAAIYITEGLQAETVAIVHDNQDYSKGLADAVQKGVPGAEGPFIINPEETDYSAVVAEVNDVNPDVVFYGGYVPQAGPLAKQLQDAGIEAQFLSDDGTKDNAFGELAGNAAPGAQVTCPCADPAEAEAGADFVAGMEEEYGEPAGTFAAEAFDSVNLMAEGLSQYDAETPVEDIRAGLVEYLDNVDGFEGIVKSYTFGDTGNVEVGPSGIFVWEWDDASGQFAVLGTVEELVAGG
ncbi:MAG: branched-chain amino acid ABC transporter substrate-binding protein [Actinomycetota bacterium]